MRRLLPLTLAVSALLATPRADAATWSAPQTGSAPRRLRSRSMGIDGPLPPGRAVQSATGFVRSAARRA